MFRKGLHCILGLCQCLHSLQKTKFADFCLTECLVSLILLFQKVMAHKQGFPWRDIRTLGQLQSFVNCDLSAMINMVHDLLTTEPYSKAEICKILEVTEEEFHATSLGEKTYTGKSK